MEAQNAGRRRRDFDHLQEGREQIRCLFDGQFPMTIRNPSRTCNQRPLSPLTSLIPQAYDYLTGDFPISRLNKPI
jgi:hypothetical protein